MQDATRFHRCVVYFVHDPDILVRGTGGVWASGVVMNAGARPAPTPPPAAGQGGPVRAAQRRHPAGQGGGGGGGGWWGGGGGGREGRARCDDRRPPTAQPAFSLLAWRHGLAPALDAALAAAAPGAPAAAVRAALPTLFAAAWVLPANAVSLVLSAAWYSAVARGAAGVRARLEGGPPEARPRTARPPSDAGGGGGSGPGVAEAGPADDVYRAALFAAIFAEAALVGMLPVIGGPKMAGEGMVGRTEVRVAPGQSPADARPLTPLQAGQQAPP